MELDEELKKQIIRLIEENEEIPDSFRSLLFPPKDDSKEIELRYGIKEREDNILADTLAMPFQPAMTFGISQRDEWHNMLIFGDNLQALKHLKKLQDDSMLEKIKLVYIDPPFGTGDIYDANGVPAYSAALQGAEFLEFLRKRLVFIRELLAEDGSLFIRIDYHFGHYVKVILDELFGKQNFRNEIVVRRGQAKAGFLKQFTQIKSLAVGYDTVFWYSLSPSTRFGKISKAAQEEHRNYGRWSNLIKAKAYERPTMQYEILGIKPDPAPWMWSKNRAFRAVENYNAYVEIAKDSAETLEDYWERSGRQLEFVRRKGNQIQYWIPPRETELVDNNWLDIKGYDHITDYPTENSEELLDRIMQITSPNDLILDCFAGSGTTGAVADKKGRRWVMVDSGKFSIYTITKRLHTLKKEIGNKGSTINPKPFVLYNAGLYENHNFILKMGEENFKRFALELFQAEPKVFEINGLCMDGVLFNCPVKVFSQKGYLTEGYVDDLHRTVGQFIRARMFIIAPAGRVYFLQDYVEKDGLRYYVLRIPYSIIDELHKRTFTRPLQPTSARDINQNIEQIGFDFIHPPNVDVDYIRRKPRDKLIEDELVIVLRNIEPVQRSREPVKFDDPTKGLSMVLVDTDYNGEYFRMTSYHFADDVGKEDNMVRLPAENLGERICIIYIDIFGNERIEVKSIRDFKRE